LIAQKTRRHAQKLRALAQQHRHNPSFLLAATCGIVLGKQTVLRLNMLGAVRAGLEGSA
jgi:hypothetical protein